MKQFYALLILLLFSATANLGYSQNLTRNFPGLTDNRACGTTENHNHLMQSSPEYAQGYQQAFEKVNQVIEERRTSGDILRVDGEVITIPIVFHIVHAGEPIGTFPNLSEQQILDQVEQLNLDFRAMNSDISNVPAEFQDAVDDLEVEFCLAVRDPDGNPTNGINRYDYGQNSFTSSDFNNNIKPATIWDRDSYLNFWTCQDLTSGSNSLLGYAQFPGGAADTDGIVCIASTVGSVDNPNPNGGIYARGRTATHEVGHWLFLFHIWGDVNGGGCSGDDEVSDTPDQSSEYTGTPTHPQESCDSNDMFMNYMDYVNDVAMFMFTFGQQERTSATLVNQRASLQNSMGCVPVDRFELGIVNEQVDICQGDNGSLDFELIFYGNYSEDVSFSVSGLPGASTGTVSQNPANSAGTYSVNISNTGGISAGTYPFSITGDDGSDTSTINVELIISTPVSGTSMLISPENNAEEVTIPVQFEWSELAGASNYLLEVSTESNFSVDSYSATVSSTETTVSSLSDDTEYYWRVTPQNSCGTATTSSVFNFVTRVDPSCINAITDSSFEASLSPNLNWEEISTEDSDLITSNFPYTGDNSAQVGAASNEIAIIWQQVTIPENAFVANLHYFYSIDSEETFCGQDVGGITTVTVGEEGITYTTGYLDYNLCTDTSSGYQEGCFDLLSFAGQTINIGFYSENNFARPSSLYIDDVRLEICTKPQETIPTDTNEYIADYEMTDAEGWTHYLDDNNTPCNFLDDVLLLSIQKNGEPIGAVGDAGFEVRLVSDPTSTQISTDYNNNSLQWFSFNRYWDVTPVNQPTSAIKIRQYYANNDVEGMEAAAEAVSGGNEDIDLAELIAWKINNNPTNWNADPSTGHTGIPDAPQFDGDGFWEYMFNSTTSSTNEFTVGMYPSTLIGPYHYMEYEVGHFSGGGVANPQTLLLPVEFTEFTANAVKTDAELNWETATEQESDYFIIERSFNGTDFELAGSVNSQAGPTGYSQIPLSYTFTDANAAVLGDRIYYRLKQVDLDGDVFYSEIRLVDFSNAEIPVLAFPNPVEKGNTFIVQSRNLSSVQLVSVQGQLVYSVQYDQPIHSTSISTGNLSSGIYYVIVNKTQTLKLVIH